MLRQMQGEHREQRAHMRRGVFGALPARTELCGERAAGIGLDKSDILAGGVKGDPFLGRLRVVGRARRLLRFDET